jgi:hypothetical protein
LEDWEDLDAFEEELRTNEAYRKVPPVEGLDFEAGGMT